jgi:hypothetical protein
MARQAYRGRLLWVAVVAIPAILVGSAFSDGTHHGRDRKTPRPATAAGPTRLHAIAAANLKAALEAMDAAGKAVERGDQKGALAHLATARRLVAATHDALADRARPRFANARCPMMGTEIDPEKVPAALTAAFRGRNVAFCCAGCPVAWDKLSDAEREARLEKAAPRSKPVSAPAGAGVSNTPCPLTGSRTDPQRAAEGLTRRFRGRTVGFCCRGCPAAWDKLSDQGKEARPQEAERHEQTPHK